MPDTLDTILAESETVTLPAHTLAWACDQYAQAVAQARDAQTIDARTTVRLARAALAQTIAQHRDQARQAAHAGTQRRRQVQRRVGLTVVATVALWSLGVLAGLTGPMLLKGLALIALAIGVAALALLAIIGGMLGWTWVTAEPAPNLLQPGNIFDDYG